MRLRYPSLLAVATVAALAAPALAQNANPTLLALTCQGCHGGQGKSPGQIPAINGRTMQQVAEILRDFREGKRPATVMTRIAKGYTDEEIEAIAKEVAAWK